MCEKSHRLLWETVLNFLKNERFWTYFFFPVTFRYSKYHMKPEVNWIKIYSIVFIYQNGNQSYYHPISKFALLYPAVS